MSDITNRLTGFLAFLWDWFLLIGFILGATVIMAIVVFITFAPVIILILIFTGGLNG